MQTFPGKKYARNLQDPFRNSNSKPCHKYLYASYMHCSNDELSRLVPCCWILVPSAVISKSLMMFCPYCFYHPVQGTASLGLRYEWTWPLGCAPWMIQWLHHGYSIAGTYIMLIPSYIAVNLSSCTLRPLIRSDYIMI